MQAAKRQTQPVGIQLTEDEKLMIICLFLSVSVPIATVYVIIRVVAIVIVSDKSNKKRKKSTKKRH